MTIEVGKLYPHRTKRYKVKILAQLETGVYLCRVCLGLNKDTKLIEYSYTNLRPQYIMENYNVG